MVVAEIRLTRIFREFLSETLRLMTVFFDSTPPMRLSSWHGEYNKRYVNPISYPERLINKFLSRRIDLCVPDHAPAASRPNVVGFASLGGGGGGGGLMVTYGHVTASAILHSL